MRPPGQHRRYQERRSEPDLDRGAGGGSPPRPGVCHKTGEDEKAETRASGGGQYTPKTQTKHEET